MFACTLFGIERQVYYRKIKTRKTRQSNALKIVSMVLEIRQTMPRIGAKKLYYLLNNELKQLKIGRDKFINILKIQSFTNHTKTFISYNNQLTSSF